MAAEILFIAHEQVYSDEKGFSKKEQSRFRIIEPDELEILKNMVAVQFFSIYIQ